MELNVELDNLKLNVSAYCNEKLWDYVTSLKGKLVLDNKDLTNEINKLQATQNDNIKAKAVEVSRLAAGIDDKMLKFLTNMSNSIAVAKDNMNAWENMTGERRTTSELKELKNKWC